MSICKNCGTEVGNNQFCTKCGTKQEKPVYENIGTNTGDNLYGEFKKGAQVWFALCGVFNILVGIGQGISALTTMRGYVDSSEIMALLLGLLGIVYGAAYFFLLATRQKKAFLILVVLATITFVCNIIMQSDELGLFVAIVTSMISPVINIGITAFILSKYEHNTEASAQPQVVQSSVPSTDSMPNNPMSTGSICCPKCGSNNLQAVSESNTSGGGYNASNGCCGYILLGPLGLLCGACGNKTKTTNRTFFVCMNCGNKFAK